MKNARVLAAEFLGTFALVFFGAGSIVNAAALRAGQLGSSATVANINRSFGPVDLLFVAFAHAIVLAVMVTALGHVSGAHFNPAVTVAAFVGGHIEPALEAMYIVTQLLAGIAASLLLKFIYPADLLSTVKWGAPFPGCRHRQGAGGRGGTHLLPGARRLHHRNRSTGRV